MLRIAQFFPESINLSLIQIQAIVFSRTKTSSRIQMPWLKYG